MFIYAWFRPSHDPVRVRFKDGGQVQGYKVLFKVMVKDSVTAVTTCISSGMVSDFFFYNRKKKSLNDLRPVENSPLCSHASAPLVPSTCAS